jgi:delta-aminolevulinic acid dehydratase/porphobilinogen synthase
MVAPSDMMDGRAVSIRSDWTGQVSGILPWRAAKFASCFYAPFRDAAGSAPSSVIVSPTKWTRRTVVKPSGKLRLMSEEAPIS